MFSFESPFGMNVIKLFIYVKEALSIIGINVMKVEILDFI